MYPHELKKLIDDTKNLIESTGFVQTDKRLGRKTMTVIGSQLVIDEGNILRYLKSEKPLAKFLEDWNRMKPWFDSSLTLAGQDLDSRRLVLFNAPFRDPDYPCFTQMQLVRDDESFTVVVTQRSGDVAKMKDDLVFFGSICHKWEQKLRIKIRKIVVCYSHIHYQID